MTPIKLATLMRNILARSMERCQTLAFPCRTQIGRRSMH